MKKKLLEKRSALLAECEALEEKADSENRAMTTEEFEQHRSKLNEVKSISDQIAALDVRENASTESRESLGEVDKHKQQQERGAPGAPGRVEVGENNAEKKPFLNMGEQLRAVREFYTENTYDERLRKYDLRDVKVRAAAGMNEGVGSEGGFLVQTQQGPMLEKEAFETGFLSREVEQIPLDANSNGIEMPFIDETSRATGSRWGGVRGYWLAEAQALTESKPAVGKFKLGLNKFGVLVYLTDEVLQDASASGAIVNKAVSEEIGFAMDDAIFRGSGAGVPQGFMSSGALITVAKETSQIAATIVYENVSKMRIRMSPRMYAGAKWYINQECLPQLEQMQIKTKNVAGTENVGGTPVYVAPGGASAAPYGTLFGRPIQPIEHCEALGTVGDIVLANLGWYMMTTKGGVQTASSIHVKFLTDEQVFRFIIRTDGRTPVKSPISPYKGGATISPFVALATRS